MSQEIKKYSVTKISTRKKDFYSGSYALVEYSITDLETGKTSTLYAGGSYTQWKKRVLKEGAVIIRNKDLK